uniref:Uncharacterized protein n=1 Tax=Picea glauca TaxID=3330 RepID=A0A101LVN1_PICGL|nr:hypothetical protein ABT39_MTgene1986 [Picea glauca]
MIEEIVGEAANSRPTGEEQALPTVGMVRSPFSFPFDFSSSDRRGRGTRTKSEAFKERKPLVQVTY